MVCLAVKIAVDVYCIGVIVMCISAMLLSLLYQVHNPKLMRSLHCLESYIGMQGKHTAETVLFSFISGFTSYQE